MGGKRRDALVLVAGTLTLSACRPNESPRQDATTPTQTFVHERMPDRAARQQALVVNGGFDGSAPWRTVSACISDGVAVLLRSPNERFAQVRQPLTGLEPDTRYLLSVRLRAEGKPDGEIVIDLVGLNYESTDGKLRVLPTEIGPRFNTFARFLQSGAPPVRTLLRILSFSSVPIVVDDVSLLKVD